MARISGVDIPNDKRIEVALTYIFGIGLTRSQQILSATGISPLAGWNGSFFICQDNLAGSFARQIDIALDDGLPATGSEQVERRAVGQNLPVHGQRTRTNARQKRGARKTVAGKRRAGKK